MADDDLKKSLSRISAVPNDLSLLGEESDFDILDVTVSDLDLLSLPSVSERGFDGSDQSAFELVGARDCHWDLSGLETADESSEVEEFKLTPPSVIHFSDKVDPKNHINQKTDNLSSGYDTDVESDEEVDESFRRQVTSGTSLLRKKSSLYDDSYRAVFRAGHRRRKRKRFSRFQRESAYLSDSSSGVSSDSEYEDEQESSSNLSVSESRKLLTLSGNAGPDSEHGGETSVSVMSESETNFEITSGVPPVLNDVSETDKYLFPEPGNSSIDLQLQSFCPGLNKNASFLTGTIDVSFLDLLGSLSEDLRCDESILPVATMTDMGRCLTARDDIMPPESSMSPENKKVNLQSEYSSSGLSLSTSNEESPLKTINTDNLGTKQAFASCLETDLYLSSSDSDSTTDTDSDSSSDGDSGDSECASSCSCDSASCSNSDSDDDDDDKREIDVIKERNPCPKSCPCRSKRIQKRRIPKIEREMDVVEPLYKKLLRFRLLRYENRAWFSCCPYECDRRWVRSRRPAGHLRWDYE